MEVYSYQELKLNNCTDKTRAFAQSLGKYLKQIDDVVMLRAEIDGQSYLCEEDSINEESELYSACSKLAACKEIAVRLRTRFGPDLSERLDGCFSALREDDLRGFLSYRSTDYYDDDETVELCLYDEEGLQFPACTSESTDCISDISLWYCNTPELWIDAGDESENEELHEKLSSLLKAFMTDCCVEEDVEERLTDDWEDGGELGLEGNIWFRTESIPKMKDLLENMMECVAPYDTVELRLHIQSISDGEGDYDFASVAFTAKQGHVQVSCCRF